MLNFGDPDLDPNSLEAKRKQLHVLRQEASRQSKEQLVKTINECLFTLSDLSVKEAYVEQVAEILEEMGKEREGLEARMEALIREYC